MPEAWFELKTPGDLFAKLRADCERLQLEPADSHAAFDFFVTAWHLVDWLHPGDAGKVAREALVNRSPLLSMCRRVANGVKHFELGDPRTGGVSETAVEGPFDRTFDFSFDRVRLVLHLDGAARDAYGETVQVSELARTIVAWWAAELQLEP